MIDAKNDEGSRKVVFYFNGSEMPQWTSNWQLLPLAECLNDYCDNWDEGVGYGDIWRLRGKLSNLSVVESLDPLSFCICAQEIIILILREFGYVVEKLDSLTRGGVNVSAQEIVNSMLSGCVEMVKKIQLEGLAFWISGGVEDQQRLQDTILQWQDIQQERWSRPMLPYEREAQIERLRRIGFQRRKLRDFLSQAKAAFIPRRELSAICDDPLRAMRFLARGG